MKGSFAGRRMRGKAEMVVVWAAAKSSPMALRGWADCESAKMSAVMHASVSRILLYGCQML